MKQRLTLWAAGVALLAATLLPIVFHAQPGSPQPGAPAATPPVAAASPAPQRHPRIVAAIRNLEQARRELDAAEGDFHGHRAKAIGHVNQAIEECNKALEFPR
jgi:hypothetical protein